MAQEEEVSLDHRSLPEREEGMKRVNRQALVSDLSEREGKGLAVGL